MPENGVKDLTLGEKVLNWAKALGIILPLVGAGVVSVLGWFKSDNAQGDVRSVIQQLDKRVAKQESVINAQSEKLERMLRRMIFFQAHQEGVASGKLLEKNEQLEKQITELRTKTVRTEKLDKLVEILRSEKPTAKSEPPPEQMPVIPRIKSKPFKKAD